MLLHNEAITMVPTFKDGVTCTSYNMAARALADLSHEGAKRPSATNQLNALVIPEPMVMR